ncbi:MAG: nitrous oxide reductase family maturation protein NosD [Candidatus Hermodarchaeota archaeon]
MSAIFCALLLINSIPFVFGLEAYFDEKSESIKFNHKPMTSPLFKSRLREITLETRIGTTLQVDQQASETRYSKTTQTQIPLLSSPSLYSANIPILIDGDNDFRIRAINYGWPGEGTSKNPIIITNYVITNSQSRSLITIQNTDLHFIIRNNLLIGMTGISKGISLQNTQNGIIENNTILNNEIGIDVASSIFTTIERNTIADNYQGLLISGSGHIISSNNIHNNTFSGISMRICSSSNVMDNIIHDNHVGVDIRGSKYVYFSRNVIYKNYLGLSIDRSTDYAFILSNDFLGNGPGMTYSQAYDDGTNSRFESNYWADWTNPNANRDDTVDNPYPIDGNAKSSDPSPQTDPNNPIAGEFTSTPRIFSNNLLGSVYNFIVSIVSILVIVISIIGLKFFISSTANQKWINRPYTHSRSFFSSNFNQRFKELCKVALPHNFITGVEWYLLSAEISLFLIFSTSAPLTTGIFIQDIGSFLLFAAFYPLIHPWAMLSAFSALSTPPFGRTSIWAVSLCISILFIHIATAGLLIFVRTKVFKSQIYRELKKPESPEIEKDWIEIVIISEEKVLDYAEKAQQLVKDWKKPHEK